MKKAGLRFILLGAILVALQIALAACGTAGIGQNLGSTQLARTSGNTHRPQNNKNSRRGNQHSAIIQLGLNLPLSGADASLGLSAEDGAQLALSQARIPGYTLQLVAKNDANASGVPDATLAASNLSALIKDTQVAGVIGAFDTSTAEAELPLANKAQLALISPSATFTCLTQASAAANCGTLLSTLRPTGTTTFFRLAPTDIQQGATLGNFAYQSRFYRKVYVIDDTSASGVALANGFISQFQSDGGTIISHMSVGLTPSYINLLTQAASLKPDLIFYAGGDTEGINLRRQMFQIPGLQNTPFIGGNSIHTPAFAQALGFGGGGPIYSISPSLSLTSGSFVQQYQAKYGPLGTYSAAGYDSANILIAAIKSALASKVKPATGSGNQVQISGKFRLAIIHALAQTKLESVTGAVQYTFTASGDPVNNVLQIDTLNTPSQWTRYTTVAVI